MIAVVIVGVIWIVSGIFAYGLSKGICRTNCALFKEKYGLRQEFSCWILACLGVVGLFLAYDNSYSNVSKTRPKDSASLCFRMPKELLK